MSGTGSGSGAPIQAHSPISNRTRGARLHQTVQAREAALRTAAINAGANPDALPASEDLVVEDDIFVDDFDDNDDAIPADIRDKLKIPTPGKFDGRRDPDTIRAWLYEYNNYAAFHALSDRRKITMIPYFLLGSAATWWASLQNNREVPATWEAVENLIKTEFLPLNYINRLRSQLFTLRQTTSVANYSSTFRRLLINLPSMDKDVMLHLYVAGLKQETRLAVEMQEPTTLNEAERHALKVDDIRYGKQNYPDKKPNPPGNKNGNVTAAVTTTTADKKKLSKLNDTERKRLMSIGACFRCRKTGHVSRDCPNRQNDSQSQPHQPSRQRLPAAAVDAVATQTPPENGQHQ